MTVKTRARTTLGAALLTTAVAGGLFLAPGAEAAGLGKLTVLSALGQPLSAEIELSTAPGEEASLSARLASVDAFRQANIEFHPALLTLRFHIEQRGGRQFIKINSAQPVNEPFVDLLLELRWESGRLVREYTFLLDPVDMRDKQVAEQVTPVAPPPVSAGASSARPAAAARSAGTAAVAGGSGQAARPVRRAAPKASGDRLTLSTGMPDAPMSTVAPVAKEKTISEVLERVKELERLVSALERSIALRNAADAAQGIAAPATANAPAPVLPAMPTLKRLPPAGVANAPSDTAPAAPAPAAAPAARAKPAPASAALPAKTEPGFMAQVLDHMLYVLGALVLLTLAAAGLLYARRRKQESAASQSLLFSEPGDPSAPMATQSVAADPLTSIETSADNGNSAFNSSFSPSASHLDINEVDPVAEAGVYIAYGRDEQAEEILREAMRRHPRLVAVRLKLMEIYAARKDQAAFSEQAREVHALTRGEGEEWGHALALGLLVDPANALYSGAAPAGTATAPAAEFAQAGELGGTGRGGDHGAHDSGTDDSAAEAALQQEFKDALRAAARAGQGGDSAGVAAPAMYPAMYPARTEDATLAFDLSALDFAPAGADDAPQRDAQPVAERAHGAPVPSFGALDLTKPGDHTAAAPAAVPDLHVLDFDLPDPALPAQTPAAPAPTFDMSAMELDLPWATKVADAPALEGGNAVDNAVDNTVDNTEGSPVFQQMETKLDLAVAYREIGNEEGARELLDEVIKEGCPEHAAKAVEMLAELA